MDGKAWSYTGHGIWCCSLWAPGSAAMEMSGILHVQSFMRITSFGRTLHMKGALAVLVEKDFLGFG